MKRNKVEVIAWTLDDALEIQKSGADRIELVADLSRGGLSPNIDLVKQVIELTSIPTRVMVRCTDESFVYSKEQMNEHLEFISEVRKAGAEGIVFGSLTEEGRINFEQLQEVILVKGNMKLTFHRAFDEIDESIILEEYEKLTKFDVDTILTSGTKGSAWEGKELIKKLISKKKINILPGKSIDINNAKKIIDYTGANFVHVGYAVRTDDTESGQIDYNKVVELINSIN